MTGEETKALNDFKPSYSCRFHPTDGWHEVGCLHQKWTVEQLQEALNNAKQNNSFLVYQLEQVKRENKDKIKKLYDRWINDLEMKRFVSVNPVLFWLERAMFELESKNDIREAKRALNFINKKYKSQNTQTK